MVVRKPSLISGEVSSAPSNAKVTAEAKQGSWNLLRTLKLLGSDEVEDSVPSFNLKVCLLNCNTTWFAVFMHFSQQT